MPPHRSPPPLRTLATFALLFIALAALLTAPSLLVAASPDPAPPASGGPTTPTAVPARHSVESDGAYTAQGLTSARWDIGAIQADWSDRPIWQAPVTGKGSRVAVIDTGIDPTHPDLDERIVAWRDFVNGRDEPYDDTGHGTHVAGIIAGEGHTQLNPLEPYFFTGARGVAPDAELMAAKVMDENGEGNPARIAEAILWSLNPDGDHDPEKSAHIINLSLGIGITTQNGDSQQTNLGLLGPGGSTQMRQVHDAIQTATQAGAVVVVAAGNHDPDTAGEIFFPGTMDEVITVGALNEHGHVAAFSNHGAPGSSKPDLVAPGVIISTAPTKSGTNTLYQGLGGTSMAAPFVAGTIALVMESDPSLRSISFHQDRSDHTTTIRGLLKDAAVPVPGAGPHEQGAGLLRVDATLAQVDAGPGELRPAAYAVPFVVAGSGAYFVRRRRQRTHAAKSQRDPGPAQGPTFTGRTPGPTTPAMAQKNPSDDSGWHGPHHAPSIPLRPIPIPARGTPPTGAYAALGRTGRHPGSLPRHPRARPPPSHRPDLHRQRPDGLDTPTLRADDTSTR